MTSRDQSAPSPEAINTRSAQPPNAAPWWRGAVIYQIYPRSFLDTNGDGVGDLAGILSRLDHVAWLGVDGIWLSPFFRSPMRDFGYDVSDYRDIDPLFGTLDDFDALVAKAHGLGLKVIIDQVYSHTSDQHAWFTESRSSRDNPKADWYVWADAKPDGAPPNNWQSVFSGCSWKWDARRRQYYFHNFLASQPDLNLHNPAVQDALLDVARFWLDRGVDGFRLDAINFAMHDPQLRDNPPVRVFRKPPTRPFDFQEHRYNQSHPDIVLFLERLRSVLDTYEARFTVAEVCGPDALSEMKAFTAGSKRLNTAYSFDYLYADELSPALIRAGAEDWPGAADEGWPSWAFSNHDAPRAVSRWAKGHDPDGYAKFTLLLLIALRGNIFVYQGEELGLVQGEVSFDRLQDPEAIANWPLTLGRDGARTPIPWSSSAPFSGFSTAEPWLPIDRRHRSKSVEAQEADPSSVLNFARAAIALRQSCAALRYGNVRYEPSPDGVVVFMRDNGAVLCAFNLSNAPATIALGNTQNYAIALAANIDADRFIPTLLPPASGFIALLRS